MDQVQNNNFKQYLLMFICSCLIEIHHLTNILNIGVTGCLSIQDVVLNWILIILIWNKENTCFEDYYRVRITEIIMFI
jgi:hypothetical protein